MQTSGKVVILANVTFDKMDGFENHMNFKLLGLMNLWVQHVWMIIIATPTIIAIGILMEWQVLGGVKSLELERTIFGQRSLVTLLQSIS